MTELVIAVGHNLIDEAMNSVDIAEPLGDLSPDALQKLAGTHVAAAVAVAWERIRGLLHDAARRGADAIQASVDSFNRYMEELLEQLNEDADAFREMLSSKLDALMQEMMDKVLRSVRNRVLIGSDVYTLNSITLQNKLVYTGSIEVSLTALCRFIAAGETVVTGTYGLTPIVPPR